MTKLLPVPTLPKLPPPPPPSSANVRTVMQANRGRDTGPEVAIRSGLHRRGLRFRKHVRPLTGLRCQADVVFPTERIAVFIDGCWWHGCKIHGHPAKSNSDWWRVKIERNILRDRRNDATLKKEGWHVIRAWEHEPPTEVVGRIIAAVIDRRSELAAHL